MSTAELGGECLPDYRGPTASERGGGLKDFGILRVVTAGRGEGSLSGTGATQWATTLGKGTVKSDAYLKRFDFSGFKITLSIFSLFSCHLSH